jgi:hypothetical protein
VIQLKNTTTSKNGDFSPGEDNTKIYPSEVTTSKKTYEETVTTRAITTKLLQESEKV